MARPRLILHVDMDAFYAGVEQRDRPELRGLPVIVGGGVRGVVTTCSYEARVFGCRSAMPMAQALRLCPQAVVIKPRMGVYSAESGHINEIFNRFTPDVQAVGIDESYLDCTGSWHLFGPAAASDDDAAATRAALHAGALIARQIKDQIRAERNLIASVGVAQNKLLAKMASDMDKPDGLRVISDVEAPELLAPLPVGSLRGVGPSTVAALKKIAILTCADLRAAPEDLLVRALGSHARGLQAMAWGRDVRPVESRGLPKSVGQSRTFSRDLSRYDDLRSVLLGQTEHVASELRAEKLVARRVTVTFRRPDFETFTRSSTLDEPTCQTDALWVSALALLDAWWKQHPGPLRLIGVMLGNIEAPGQMSLFSAPTDAKAARVDAALDAIKTKFGEGAIGRAGRSKR